jgi:hypothetical protein
VLDLAPNVPLQGTRPREDEAHRRTHVRDPRHGAHELEHAGARNEPSRAEEQRVGVGGRRVHDAFTGREVRRVDTARHDLRT